jgi:paraquat-inducible protein A
MTAVIVCPACDLAHRRSAELVGAPTQCTRCRAPLQRPHRAAIDNAIALALSGSVLLFLSNAYPLVVMHVNGSSRQTTLIGAALGLYRQGYAMLAALVFSTTVIAPLLQIASLLYVLIPLRRKRRAFRQNAVFRVFARIRHWSFIDVFMLGSLVALVRLARFSDIVPGIALWSCGLLMLILSALTSITSPEQLWRWVEQSRE